MQGKWRLFIRSRCWSLNFSVPLRPSKRRSFSAVLIDPVVCPLVSLSVLESVVVDSALIGKDES